MKIIYRFNSFETNSSSTHSLILCSLEDYEKLKNEEIYLDYSGSLYYPDEIEQASLTAFKEFLLEYKNGISEEILDNFNFNSFEDFNKSVLNYFRNVEDLVTLDEWCDSDYLNIEEYKDEKLGVIAIAKYGYDG